MSLQITLQKEATCDFSTQCLGSEHVIWFYFSQFLGNYLWLIILFCNCTIGLFNIYAIFSKISAVDPQRGCFYPWGSTLFIPLLFGFCWFSASIQKASWIKTNHFESKFRIPSWSLSSPTLLTSCHFVEIFGGNSLFISATACINFTFNIMKNEIIQDKTEDQHSWNKIHQQCLELSELQLLLIKSNSYNRYPFTKFLALTTTMYFSHIISAFFWVQCFS